MEQRHVRGDHGVEARMVGSEGARRSGHRTCLSCNSALLRMSASASRVAIMQLLMAEASILTSRCGPVHTEGEWVVCLEAAEEREGVCVCVDACVVRLLCGLRSAVCGAVRCGAYRGGT